MMPSQDKQGTTASIFRRGFSPSLSYFSRRCELACRRSFTFIAAASFLGLSIAMSFLSLYQGQRAEDEVCKNYNCRLKTPGSRVFIVSFAAY